jgi:hypothetical protein
MCAGGQRLRRLLWSAHADTLAQVFVGFRPIRLLAIEADYLALRAPSLLKLTGRPAEPDEQAPRVSTDPSHGYQTATWYSHRAANKWPGAIRFVNRITAHSPGAGCAEAGIHKLAA